MTRDERIGSIQIEPIFHLTTAAFSDPLRPHPISTAWAPWLQPPCDFLRPPLARHFGPLRAPASPPPPAWPPRARGRASSSFSAQSNFSRVVQTAWKAGKDAVEAGTNVVPGSVPRPIARIGLTFVALSVAFFLLKSIVSTAIFVLAMMGLIYFGFLAMNPKEEIQITLSLQEERIDLILS
ncbi:hypothetical protein GUJ93_ZPchr0009g150 [Zizania palustris]|uniref:Uncharacterized protein n=1 Tax=Zizania palustris TaxID=103762 RepID=A0A8J5RMK0_ZIZPA|nr:hypothetical protein GUJ93_ZPchr0009g150 [Zizania palustris]